DERRKVPRVAVEIARAKVEHDRVARLVVGEILGVELDHLRAQLAARKARRPARDATDAIRADDRARTIDVALLGLDAHAMILDRDRSDRRAVAHLDAARHRGFRERVIELDAPYDDAELAMAGHDRLVADLERDRVEPDHRALNADADLLEHAKRA